MSLLRISQKALRRIGAPEITSLSQNNKPAVKCLAAVEGVVKEVIEEHPWSFATEWDSLPLRSDAPPFGYLYAYQLPTNYVALLDVRSTSSLSAPEVEHDLVADGVIYTNVSPCYARYTVYNEKDLARAPSGFISSCSWLLAAEICSPLSRSDKIGTMEQGYLVAKTNAILADARNSNATKTDENATCSILAARSFPTSGYDEETE